MSNVISRDHLIEHIKHQSNKVEVTTIAIEGFGGSGKSSLANYIQESFPENEVCIVNMDDFIIKTKVLSGWNNAFDITRLQDQVLKPSRSGKISYQKYIWDENRLSDYEFHTDYKILIIEGISAFRPDLESYFDLKIWVDTPIELSNARGKYRDSGNENEKHWNRWSELDLEYLKEFKSKERADFVVSTVTDYSDLKTLIDSAKDTITIYQTETVEYYSNLLNYIQWVQFINKSKKKVKWNLNLFIEEYPTYKQLQHLLFLTDFLGNNFTVNIVQVAQSQKESVWLIDNQPFLVSLDNKTNKIISKQIKSYDSHFESKKPLEKYLEKFINFLKERRTSYIDDSIISNGSEQFLDFDNNKKLYVSFRSKKNLIGWLVQLWLEELNPDGIPDSGQERHEYFRLLGIVFGGLSSVSLEPLETNQDIGVQYMHVFADSSYDENVELLHKLNKKTVSSN